VYCTKCGAQNAENAWKCVQCGHELRPAATAAPQPVRIPNYLVHAILCTLFCCLPLGIVAIVYAAQVNSKAAAGDIARAEEAWDVCRWFGAGGGGRVLLLFVFFFCLVGGGAFADT